MEIMDTLPLSTELADGIQIRHSLLHFYLPSSLSPHRARLGFVAMELNGLLLDLAYQSLSPAPVLIRHKIMLPLLLW